MEENNTEQKDTLAFVLDNIQYLAIFQGLFLIIFGVAMYIITDQSSVTSLIPSFIGAGLFFPGYLVHSKPSTKMHAMHATALFALIGTLGGFMAIPSIMEGDWGNATIARLVLLLVCGDYIVLSIMSFRRARMNRLSKV